MSGIKRKTNWSQTVLKLKPDHGWRATPVKKILVADRGAVRFDIPKTWVVVPGNDSIRFNDKPPPDDDCLLQVSVIYLRGDLDWGGFPLTRCLEEALKADNTMEFWPEHTNRFGPVWDEVLRSLTLGDYVEEPTRRLVH